MYNRYIPRNDGSYHRRPVPEPHNSPPPPSPAPLNPPEPVAAPSAPSHGSPVSFLKNLLPKNFDAGDLIVILLLLLMAGDCEEDQNTALLTLALYFFM